MLSRVYINALQTQTPTQTHTHTHTASQQSYTHPTLNHEWSSYLGYMDIVTDVKYTNAPAIKRECSIIFRKALTVR